MMIITRTPLRISFFGGGTDYPVWYRERGGAVLSTAIDKYNYITTRLLPPFFDHKTMVVWSRIEKVRHHDQIVHPAVRETMKYVGIEDGLGVHFDADLPARTGLGSSSAFTVGFLNALYALKGVGADKQKLAADAIHIEQNLIREHVGSQDQVAAAFGGFNRIDFGGPEEFRVTPVAVASDRLAALQDHCMLFFTGFARTASAVAAAQIKNTPEKHAELKRMQEMVSEAQTILEQPNGNFADFGRLLDETWQLKRTLSHRITGEGIDGLYGRARAAGAWGGKLLGAGGGGFFLVFAPPETQPKIKEALKDFRFVPARFEREGSIVIHQTA